MSTLSPHSPATGPGVETFVGACVRTRADTM